MAVSLSLSMGNFKRRGSFKSSNIVFYNSFLYIYIEADYTQEMGNLVLIKLPHNVVIAFILFTVAQSAILFLTTRWCSITLLGNVELKDESTDNIYYIR